MKKDTGAQFEISVDGKPRSYRDTKAIAIASAESLKSRYPNSNIGSKIPGGIQAAVSVRRHAHLAVSNAFVVIFHRAMAAERRGSASIDPGDLRRVLHRTFEHARTGR